MDHHQGALSFLDVLAEGPPVLAIAVGLHGEDVVHDLERGAHHVDEPDDCGCFLCILPCGKFEIIL